MKKVFLIFGMGLLICVFMVGCANSDAKKIVGTWEGSIESGRGSLYQRYSFEKDGTGSYQFNSIRSSVPSNFQYQINEDGTLVFSAMYMRDVVADYIFSEDYKKLTLTIEDKTYDLLKTN